MQCFGATCRFLQSSSARRPARPCRLRIRFPRSGDLPNPSSDYRVTSLDRAKSRAPVRLPRLIESLAHRDLRPAMGRTTTISLCKMYECQCFERAFEIEQGMQQKRQYHRAAAPPHPAEKKTDHENLQHPGPIVLDVQHGPEN